MTPFRSWLSRLLLTSIPILVAGAHGAGGPAKSAEFRVIAVTDASFGSEIEKSPQPVVLIFWAPWCGPCRTVAPAFEALAAKFDGRLRFAKMNSDDNPATAMRFEVRSIPVILIFDQGRVVGQIVGNLPAAELEKKIIDLLAPRRPSVAVAAD